MLLVIFGAGASYDSVHHVPPPRPRGVNNFVVPVSETIRSEHDDDRLPLANQLFENRAAFVRGMQRFGDYRPLIPLLRSSGQVEEQLLVFQEQARTYPERHKQLAAIRYYLHFVLWECQKRWSDRHNGITNHATFLDAVERWRFNSKEHVYIVTFNYDTMLEEAVEQVFRYTFNDLYRYTAYENYKFIKLHGSVNWGHATVINANNVYEIINAAADLKILDEFRMVRRSPVEFDDHTFGYPAIAIPIARKSEFECPRAHIELLANAISRVDKIITVGWRATEEHFVKMLKSPLTGLREDVDLMIVSGDQNGALETQKNLAIGAPDTERKRSLVETGFTGLINNIGTLEAFLR